MGRRRARDGQVIEIVWDDGEADVWYVRGHVADDVAIDAVTEHLRFEAEPDDEIPRVGQASHSYARWGLGWSDTYELLPRRFHEPVARRPGAFPVTLVWRLSTLEHEQRVREACAARCAAVVAWLAEFFPEATEIRPNGHFADSTSARFKLPGLLGDLRLTAEPFQLYIEERDGEAWGRLYGARVLRRLELPTPSTSTGALT